MTSANDRVSPSRAKDTRLYIRLPSGLKRAFFARAGAGRAAAEVTAFIRWYLRHDGARLPERPPAPCDSEDTATVG